MTSCLPSWPHGGNGFIHQVWACALLLLSRTCNSRRVSFSLSRLLPSITGHFFITRLCSTIPFCLFHLDSYCDYFGDPYCSRDFFHFSIFILCFSLTSLYWPSSLLVLLKLISSRLSGLFHSHTAVIYFFHFFLLLSWSFAQIPLLSYLLDQRSNMLPYHRKWQAFALVAITSFTVSTDAHSWVERLAVIDLNDNFAGAPGFPRGNGKYPYPVRLFDFMLIAI